MLVRAAAAERIFGRRRGGFVVRVMSAVPATATAATVCSAAKHQYGADTERQPDPVLR